MPQQVPGYLWYRCKTSREYYSRRTEWVVCGGNFVESGNSGTTQVSKKSEFNYIFKDLDHILPRDLVFFPLLTLPHCLTFHHYLFCAKTMTSPPRRRQTLLNLSSPIHPWPCDADAALVGVFRHSALVRRRRDLPRLQKAAEILLPLRSLPCIKIHVFNL